MVLGTLVSQTLINVIALVILGAVMFTTSDGPDIRRRVSVRVRRGSE